MRTFSSLSSRRRWRRAVGPDRAGVRPLRAGPARPAHRTSNAGPATRESLTTDSAEARRDRHDQHRRKHASGGDLQPRGDRHARAGALDWLRRKSDHLARYRPGQAQQAGSSVPSPAVQAGQRMSEERRPVNVHAKPGLTLRPRPAAATRRVDSERGDRRPNV